jgi:AbrB family looped-hinge helix DNA binding protein
VAHSDTYRIRVGDRGRLVLPAELRRRAGLKEGDELLAAYEGRVLRLALRRDLIRSGRGMFKRQAGGRDLVGELLDERRREARREGKRAPVRHR